MLKPETPFVQANASGRGEEEQGECTGWSERAAAGGVCSSMQANQVPAAAERQAGRTAARATARQTFSFWVVRLDRKLQLQAERR